MAKMSKADEKDRAYLDDLLRRAQGKSTQARETLAVAEQEERVARRELEDFDLEQRRRAPLKAWERKLLERIATGEVQRVFRHHGDGPRASHPTAWRLRDLGFITMGPEKPLRGNEVTLTDAGRAKLKEKA